MEMVEGPTLADLLARGPLPIEEALRIARQIAEALDAAHEKNITHRDLKPANGKVTPAGDVKLLDFGLAKAMASSSVASGMPKLAEDSPTLTLPVSQAGVIMGTAAYMSPEQVRGGEADRRSDIWAFGVVVHEMLTGRRLFGGESIADTLAAVLKSEIDLATLPAETPAWVRRLIGRCLERDRRKRLRDIGDAFAEESTGPAPIMPVTRRQSWILPVVAAAASLLGAAATGLLSPRAPEPPIRQFSFTPDELNGSEYARDVVVSPNGKYIAYIAARKLWIRDLAEDKARAIDGSEGAQGPFWSPDSLQIGFAADRELRKVRVSGGLPLRLCAFATVFRGGAWTPDGRAIAVSTNEGLSECPAEGGTLRQLLEDKANFFLYLQFPYRPAKPVLIANRGGRFRQSIVVMDWPPKTARELRDGFAATYSPSGHLLFQTDPLKADLWVAQWTAGAVQLSGEPVSLFPGAVSFNVSRDGTAVWADTPVRELQLTWRGRSGDRLATVGAPIRNVRQVMLAPSGGMVLSNDNDIWLDDVVRGVRTRVTSDGYSFSARWRPGSNEFAFTSNRSGLGDIFLSTAADVSREPKLILASPVQDAPEDWSPDGTTLLFRRTVTPNTDFYLLHRKPDGTYSEPEPYLTASSNKTQAQISPDGRWAVYSSNESGRFEVYVQSFPKPGAKRQISTSGGRHPRWRRNGSEIFYVDGDALMSVPVRLGSIVEPGVPKELFRNPGLESVTSFITYDVAGDGNRFLIAEPVNAASKQRSIHVIENFPAWLGTRAAAGE